MSTKKVVVGMSGGVDSSVVAYLLQKQGYDVIGIYMRNWHDSDVTISPECPWTDDSNDALLVADHLGIPFQVIDLSEAYRDYVVEYMFDQYRHGLTPNPDVLCNREIKFKAFLHTALQLDADYVATGHYCQKDAHTLLRGTDANKDQSYFLCQVPVSVIDKVLFPLGEYTKAEVRQLAIDLNLPTAHKKDSQGLCFVGKVKLPDFLKQQLAPREGKVYLLPPMPIDPVDIDHIKNEDLCSLAQQYHSTQLAGAVSIGTHTGAHYYTVGQRKGLGIGGYKSPLFITHTDTRTNQVYVVEGKNHAYLYRQVLEVIDDEINIFLPDFIPSRGEAVEVLAQIRYRQQAEPARLYRSSDGSLYTFFYSPQFAITPGQFVAWYHGHRLIGSGVIKPLYKPHHQADVNSITS